jgi:hypothetical protein
LAENAEKALSTQNPDPDSPKTPKSTCAFLTPPSFKFREIMLLPLSKEVLREMDKRRRNNYYARQSRDTITQLWWEEEVDGWCLWCGQKLQDVDIPSPSVISPNTGTSASNVIEVH